MYLKTTLIFSFVISKTQFHKTRIH